MKKTKEYNLVITPGVHVNVRQEIEDVLRKNGYKITDGGTYFSTKMIPLESNIVFTETITVKTKK